MRIEQRVQYLMRAALRAERAGDHRVARSLRRMADDILPLGRSVDTNRTSTGSTTRSGNTSSS